ncbi:DUF169 domain-containing protein [Saccharothrix saharensis]|uniref:DUF169 domain-containing protein n=1 Tax=Saccharothrix saharensis TaxID=571190 RepID=UPI003677136A
MSHPELATALTDLLSLDIPPVGLSKVDARPEGVVDSGRPVPSSCAMWRVAEKGVFYAEGAEHFNCPVGAMVMGFEMPAEVNAELGGLVQSMCDAQYLDMAEVEKIPSVRKSGVGAVYGPLADLPVYPDVVLMWLTPAQAMIYNEAAGGANWTAEAGQVSGRPGCTALALALESQQPRMALGCIGMRTFTGIAADRLLAVLPGARVGEFVEALKVTVTANAGMKSFYEGKLAQFS